MPEIKKMSKKKLIEEYKAYHQMINETGCYGTRDLLYYYALEKEIDERGFEIHTKVEVD